MRRPPTPRRGWRVSPSRSIPHRTGSTLADACSEGVGSRPQLHSAGASSGAQAVLLLVAHLRAQTQDALSRPVPMMEVRQDSAEACANGDKTASRELPVADFMEPVEYRWTEAGFEARQALRRYCEETHADY